MRSLTLGLSLASMLLSFQLSAQPSQQSISSLGSIEVVVRNFEDAPIPQVSIQITGQSYTSTALHRDADGHWVESSGDARISVMAETDNTGRARFINIPPGLYQLQAARSGYLPRDGGTLPLFKADVRVGDKANPNAFPVSFEKHQLNPIVAIRMVEEGTIGGRVRDADGQPRSGIKVTVARLYTQNGVSRFSELKSGETDDSGKYEVHGLRPGKYLARIDDNPSSEIPDVQFADR